MTYTCIYDSPLGPLTLSSDGESLTALEFGAKTNTGNLSDLPVFNDTRKWLDIYFHGDIPDFLPKIKIGGSEFKQKVCEIMSRIPYGQTTTYGSIAKEIAQYLGKERMSAQAVGGAVGHNPVAIIIPCHRVLGAQGRLTGYAYGLDIKIKLLQIEGATFQELP